MSDVVVMPVYNEVGSVETVLEAVRSYFDGEIVVVDDGSDDGTQLALAKRDDIVVVRLDHNCGYGCALRIGFDVGRELGARRLVTMDCDGQHEPAHIPEFLKALDNGADIVSGSRYLPGSATCGEAPADRREINHTVTMMINQATGWQLTDAFCGFKAYDLEALAPLRLTEPGYGLPLELWAKSWRAGLRVAEMAVERIYCDRDRTFGETLDDPQVRLAYYKDVWERALADEES